MDNGPELAAWALRDRCRLAGTATTYIEPGCPWEDPYVESFNGRVRDERCTPPLARFGSQVAAVEGDRREPEHDGDPEAGPGEVGGGERGHAQERGFLDSGADLQEQRRVLE
jgi:hypothetical protein